MTGPTRLQDAVDQLYSGSMAEFTAQRKVLAAEARKAGDRETAGQIAGLRKPTLSADTLNRLVRAAPGEVGELMDLGAELRAAEKALDGAALRELSTRRRHLVGELTSLAFDITDQTAPSPSVRDEVAATLNAALADEQVADRLLSGALVTQARWDGFGSTSLPELATVLPLRPSRAAPSKSGTTRGQRGTDAPKSRPEPTGPTAEGKSRADTAPATTTKAAAGKADDQQLEQREAAKREAEREAAQREAEREAARREAERVVAARVEAAQLEAAEADEATTSAQETLSRVDRRISELSLQLAHERRLLAEAQRAVRAAETRRRAAHLALTRAGGAPAES